MTVLAPYLKQRWVDGNGAPLYLGTISTYAAGTLIPIPTYKDSTGTQNSQPIILNARGECDLWLTPNVAYKFIVADVNGNQIPGGVIDNVVNSQLITLYGGVDTGSANAYILNFTANFTAYTDGIVIYWIPANTNTGASTININGLGVINITNADGSALVASEIVANQPATILIKGGAAFLISATNTVYGSFTANYVGFSVNPSSTTILYRKNGTLVTLIFPQSTGTSNSPFFQITGIPVLIRPIAYPGIQAPCVGFVDNGALVANGMAVVNNAGTVQFFKDGTQPSWTSSGGKGFSTITSLTYSL